MTGGAVFGYANVEVLGSDGRRSHVERRIIDAEAAIVRRIFQMCAEDIGLTRIAKALNDEHARSPRAQQGRPQGWAPSSVREFLYRELYRGVLVWNKTATRKVRGRWRQVDQPETAWVRVPVPQLRIVTDEEWDTAHERLARVRSAYLRLQNGTVLGRPAAAARATKYLLSGLLTCASCGSGLEARTRSHGRKRAPFYGCAAHFRKGGSVCKNNFEIPAEAAEEAVLSVVERTMLDPTIVEEILTAAIAELHADSAQDSDRRQALAEEQHQVEQELARLTEALAIGGREVTAVLSAIRVREARQHELQRTLGQLGRAGFDQLPEPATVRGELVARMGEMRTLLRRHVETGQHLLRRLIDGRIVANAEEDAEGRYYRFTGQGSWWGLLAGLGPIWRPIVSALREPSRNFRPQMMASPRGTRRTWFGLSAA